MASQENAVEAQRAPDPRAPRTRAAILAAFAELLRSGRTDATVRDIVASAGVSRATFYTHFASVDEVAVEMLGSHFARLRDVHLRERQELGARTATSVRAGQERLADVFWSQRDILRPLMACSSSGPAYAAIVRAFANILEEIMRTEIPRLPHGIDVRIAAIGVSNTLVGLLIAWTTGAIEADRDTLVKHLVALLPQWASEPDSPPTHPVGG